MARLRGTVTSGSTLHPMTDESPATIAQDPHTDADSTGTAPPPPGKAPAPETGTSDVQAPADELALLNENPTAAWPYDAETEQDPAHLAGLMAETPHAPRTRAEQFAFLRDAVKGPPVWHQECLSLTRQAPGIPGGVPSAHAAMLMVGHGQRVHRVRDLRRGMSVFWDDPADDNPFAHVDTVAGFITPHPTDDLNDVLFVSSDVPDDAGEVGYVRGSFFPDQWGVPFVYGSTTLNGFWLPGYGPAQVTGPSYQQTLDDALTAVRRGIHTQRQRGHTRRVAALVHDLQVLKASRAAIR